jgi:uncharacterized repeat protein (TIGR01451 family)
MKARIRLTGVGIAAALCALAAPAGAYAANDLVLTLTAAPDPVRVGGLLTYEIFVTNAGPDAASGVTVNDPLPSGLDGITARASQGGCISAQTVTCALGALAPGESASVTIEARPTRPGTLVNTASATAAGPDPNGSNDSGAVAVRVDNGPPVLSRVRLTKAVLRAGGRAALTFRLSERARVTFRVERRASGRWIAARRPFRRRAAGGRNRVRFAAARRIGRYRVRVRALDADGYRSAERRARFRVVR